MSNQKSGCIGIGILLIGLGVLLVNLYWLHDFACQAGILCIVHHEPLAEARSDVSNINKAQDYFFGENKRFSRKYNDLGIGIQERTLNYTYSLEVLDEKSFALSYAIPNQPYALRKWRYGFFEWNEQRYYLLLRSVVGATAIAKNSYGEEHSIQILCQAIAPSLGKPPAPILRNNELICAEGTEEKSRN
ncbi:type IV pilin-like G/H family protein [Tumidithrix elongata RA019]|uniref:Type IV pilin-like G/H family protein n=1 Tax=Tumidithrix elongata BACA0141 TaxID=2716417 RepID=A0AAW9Q923_9CYAN|nr:type IV pilin-like G/H family protein [Tumidithrix elongata RA019]